MQEAQEGHACLEDVDEDTFVRFAEYIHVGDYNVSSPQVVPVELPKSDSSSQAGENLPEFAAEETLEGHNPIPVEDQWAMWTTGASRNARTRKSQAHALPLFADLVYPYPEELAFPINAVGRKNAGPTEDYSEVFLCHARAYVFAEKYQVTGLKKLVCYKLHQTLHKFTIYAPRVGDIIGLIQYSYRNTPELEHSEEPLRNLLAHYAASNFKQLVQTAEFQELLAEGGAFAKDVSKKVSERL
jgi:hypothetical protein